MWLTYASCSQGGGRQVLEREERLGDLGLSRSSMGDSQDMMLQAEI
jgi:hypothetical protein